MADVAQIVTAAAKILFEVTGLRATDYIPESISPPAAIVNLTEIHPGTFGDETMDVTLDLVVLVARTRAGQQQLQAYQSTTSTDSVWAAVRANPTLGLSGVNAAILRYRSLGIEEIAAYGYVGGAFELQVTP